MDSKIAITETFDEGYSAFMAGISRKDNPYRDEPCRSHWFNGWDYAQKEEDIRR